MTPPTSPAWTLSGSGVDTVWADRRGLSVPTAVAIDPDDNVVDSPHPDPDAATVRLTLSLRGLSDDVVQHLLERLVGIRGIRPAEVPISEHNEVPVPLLAPSLIADDRVEWTITDQLSLVHADRWDMYFAMVGGDWRVCDRPVVELTPAQTWRLIRALTTICSWQFELNTAFSTAADTLRTSLRSAVTPTAPDTGACAVASQ